MEPLKVLIVDDEPLARARLREMLRFEPGVEVIGECSDGDEALTAIRYGVPDAVFLDVQMPGCDGLQMAARLPEAGRPAIVFTTAHEQFAVGAFIVAAVDFLLKPFDRDRLAEAVRRLREHQRTKSADDIVPPSGAAAGPGRLAFRADGRIVFLRVGEIRWAEADDNYVTLHLVTGRLMVRETLTAIEGRLGQENFARISRSAIVHLDQVRELQPALHGDYTVVLRDGTKLPLSRNQRSRLERFGVERPLPPGTQSRQGNKPR